MKQFQELLRQRQIALENLNLVRGHFDPDYAAQADLDVLESVEEDFTRLDDMMNKSWKEFYDAQ